MSTHSAHACCRAHGPHAHTDVCMSHMCTCLRLSCAKVQDQGRTLHATAAEPRDGIWRVKRGAGVLSWPCWARSQARNCSRLLGTCRSTRPKASAAASRALFATYMTQARLATTQ